MKKFLTPILIGLAATVTSHAAGPYHLIKQIPVGGGGFWDYLSVYPSAHRLYVSHGTKVVVINLATDQIVGAITNTPGVHGLAVAANLGLGVTSDGRENKAGIVNLKTLRMQAKVGTAKGPDGYVYDPAQKEAYLFCGGADAASVIDVRDARLVTTIPLGGRPEFATVDPAASRVYDNLENKNAVAVINTQTHQVIQRWPIAPGKSASGMAIDVKDHRLFVGCHNRKLILLDSADGKVLDSVPIGGGVDACRFDPGTHLVFASCGDGTTTVAREVTPDHLSVVQVLKTERGARTMALDPTTHDIYLVTAKFEPRSGGGRRGWRRPVPGTFKVLVYGMTAADGGRRP